MPDKCSADNCVMTHRIEALEEANRQHSKTHGNMFDRLRALETHNAVQDAHYNAIDTKLDEHTIMLKELTGKAGKRWESAVEKIMLTAIGAVAAYILIRLGLPA